MYVVQVYLLCYFSCRENISSWKQIKKHRRRVFQHIFIKISIPLGILIFSEKNFICNNLIGTVVVKIPHFRLSSISTCSTSTYTYIQHTHTYTHTNTPKNRRKFRQRLAGSESRREVIAPFAITVQLLSSQCATSSSELEREDEVEVVESVARGEAVRDRQYQKTHVQSSEALAYLARFRFSFASLRRFKISW